MTSQAMSNQLLTAPSAEEQWVEQLKCGDEGAWTQLISGEYATLLYDYLNKLLPTEEVTHDTFQEVLFALVLGIQEFDGSSPLINWIFAIAQEKVTEYYQDVHATFSYFGIQPGEAEYNLEWQARLDNLPPQARQAVILRYYVGLTIKEIAQKLGHSYQATEQLLQQARRELVKTPQTYTPVLRPSVTDAPLSVLHQVQAQWQKCVVLGMEAEAAIFAEHIELLEQMIEEPSLVLA